MSGNIISMMWQNMKKIHRRKVKILRSLDRNEKNYVPVIRRDVAMVMALIQKLTTKTISLISTVPMLVNLYGGKRKEKLTKFHFLTRVL